MQSVINKLRALANKLDELGFTIEAELLAPITKRWDDDKDLHKEDLSDQEPNELVTELVDQEELRDKIEQRNRRLQILREELARK